VLQDAEPDQEAADVEGGEAHLAGLVRVVHHLARLGLVDLVGQLAPEQLEVRNVARSLNIRRSNSSFRMRPSSWAATAPLM
jgi:hypothetical protein